MALTLAAVWLGLAAFMCCFVCVGRIPHVRRLEDRFENEEFERGMVEKALNSIAAQENVARDGEWTRFVESIQ